MKYESLEYCKDRLGGRGGRRERGSGRKIRRKRNGRERERKNERADNKRLTSRLSEWWNFKTLQIKLFIPVYKGREEDERGREEDEEKRASGGE